MVGCTPWEDGWIGETLSEKEVKAEAVKEVSYFVQALWALHIDILFFKFSSSLPDGISSLSTSSASTASSTVRNLNT